MLPFATFGSGKDKERSVIYQEFLFATSAKPEFGSQRTSADGAYQPVVFLYL